jgi:hypothetical protein
VRNATLLDLTQPGRVFDNELVTPEGMFEPVLLESMHEHPYCELIHSDFLQHRSITLERTFLP